MFCPGKTSLSKVFCQGKTLATNLHAAWRENPNERPQLNLVAQPAQNRAIKA
jgi:hypothetical protein